MRTRAAAAAARAAATVTLAAATATLAAAAVLATAGCGNPGGDLFSIEVRDPTPGTPVHRLVVTDDGRGRCNAGELERLTSDRLLEAREVDRELGGLWERDANLGAVPGRRSYRAESRKGTVTWSEGARPAPPAIAKATLLAVRLRRELC
ncbi:MAG TPA: hypothetical protein VF520_14050 [Thermoleophilaceae bacterium]|jgi:hypothetical protein